MVVYYMFDHMGAGQVQKFREGLGNGRLTASMWTDDLTLVVRFDKTFTEESAPDPS
jgi:hypothetical protein